MQVYEKSGWKFPVGALVRHKKTGHIYEIRGYCKFESTWEDGYLYGFVEKPVDRCKSEMEDGRFELVKQLYVE